jgi:hypothetical protein
MQYAFRIIEMMNENIGRLQRGNIIVDEGVFLQNVENPTFIRGCRIVSYGRTRQEAFENANVLLAVV